MTRIVSLIASSTEIVCALGLEDQLVGISHECDFPSSILGLPVCSETKFAADGKSYEIDQRVKAILQEGLSVYRVLGDRLKELKPHIILTQIQCEVCAVSEKYVKAAACEFLNFAPQILSLNTNCLNDLWRDIQKVADLLSVSDRGKLLIEKLKTRIRDIEIEARSLSSIQDSPRVVCIEWIDPLMAAGNWVPELVELAHGKNLLGLAGAHSPWMTWEDLQKQNPDKIILMPCGWNMDRTVQELPLLQKNPIWSGLKAVRNQQVYVVDGNAYFNRPGPRLVDSLEILSEIFYSKDQYRYRGTGWKVIPELQ